MDSGTIIVTSPTDDALPQIRDLPQLPSLHITPLRQLVSSRGLNVPLPLEPKASAVHETAISKPNSSSGGTLPSKLPTLEEFLNAARANTLNDASLESVSSVEPPPKTILPAFINLRAVEKLPYASFDEEGSRKRRRLDVQNGDHFGEHLQLPIPHPHSEKKPPPFGPFAILNGLNEPPPNAALFPPIEPGSIAQILTKPTKDASTGDSDLFSFDKGPETQYGERREGRLEAILDSQTKDQDSGEVGQGAETEKTATDGIVPPLKDQGKKDGLFESGQRSAEDSDEPMSPKTRGRSRRKLRKWTEEETNNLLRGVVKCGIGNWTAILAQPDLKFNKRSAANLKDRFRVCCPWAYGAVDPNEATKQLQTTLAKALMNAESTGSGAAGKILLPDPRLIKPAPEPGSTTADSAINLNADASHGGSAATESETAGSRIRTKYTFKATPTLSNKSKSTLVSLGISEPYFTIRSKRRSRRPFTPGEDEALLKGYAVHGFQWTLIQQDKHLNLSHRRATDLRDRFRTKFPHAYREGGSVNGKTVAPQNRVEESPEKPNLSLERTKSSPPHGHPLPIDVTSLVASTTNDKQKANHADTAILASGATTSLPPSTPIPSLASLDPSTSVANVGGGAFQFPLDENPTVGGNVDSPWEDNTLPPLVWDEFG